MHTPVAKNVYTCCFVENEYTNCRKCIYHTIAIAENEYTCCFAEMNTPVAENEYTYCRKCIHLLFCKKCIYI